MRIYRIGFTVSVVAWEGSGYQWCVWVCGCACVCLELCVCVRGSVREELGVFEQQQAPVAGDCIAIQQTLDESELTPMMSNPGPGGSLLWQATGGRAWSRVRLGFSSPQSLGSLVTVDLGVGSYLGLGRNSFPFVAPRHRQLLSTRQPMDCESGWGVRHFRGVKALGQPLRALVGSRRLCKHKCQWRGSRGTEFADFLAVGRSP